jgi:Leucine-rich repeat (LRR) protein
LSSNNLNGEIPVSLYNARLDTLALGGNKLEGEIRTEIELMVNLTQFSIGGSEKLTGTLPQELFTLTNLKVLKLNDASFSGPLREDDFRNLTMLEDLWLHNNQFTGTIPVSAFESMSNLESLFAYGNPGLTGYVTEALCNERGTNMFQLAFLRFDCAITCWKNCCDPCGPPPNAPKRILT